jgi:hypothetical protein
VTLLPIVVRELRVAARRKITYRIRSWTAAAAMLTCGALPPLGAMARRGGAGGAMFAILTACAFVLCLLAGVFLTADCLSSEKREGTLGLLFLTDLKGYDVVLGKFAANSLNAFYGLLAIFPVMAVPLLMGGVTGGEFWRMTLALANALFFSLAAGIWRSSMQREARRARNSTFGLLVVLAVGLPAFGELGSYFGLSQRWSYVMWASPASPFLEALEMAYLAGPRIYWCSLIASHLLGWLFVALASIALPHRWQERPKAAPRAESPGLWSRSRARNFAHRARVPAQLLAINPVLWLIGNNRAIGVAAWLIVLAWGAAMGLEVLFAPGTGVAFIANFLFSRPFVFPLKVLFALETCRFFAEGRRNGALEMLLCTPLTTQEITHGQWLALKRTFLAPLIVFFGLWLLPSLVGIFTDVKSVRLGAGSLLWPSLIFGRDAADFCAVYWFGMRLALTAKKPQMAAPLTILFVLILPFLILCTLDFIADFVLISWGVSTFHQDFRRLLSQEYQRGPVSPVPPFKPNLPPAPPVIGG